MNITRENLKLESELSWLDEMEVEQKVAEANQAALHEEAVLQTKTIPLSEVRKDIGRWRETMQEE